MGSKKTKTTTTPTVTEPYNSAFQDYTGLIGDFLDMDPTQFVAPASDLQNSAFAQAGNLGGWSTNLNQASSYANQAGSAPAPQVSAYGYNAPTLGSPYSFGGTQLGSPSQMTAAQLGSAPTATAAQVGSATGYTAPTIGSVAAPTAYSAQRTTLGSAPTVNLQGYNAPTLGGGPQVGSYGYNAPQLGDAALANAPTLNDPSRIRDFMADYQNPYTQQVINATLASYDQDAGKRMAALEAQGAASGAFGGSRFGVAEGTLQGDLARGRAETVANLLDQQYRLGAELGSQDAGAFNQYGLTRYGGGLQTALANQAATNQRAGEQAGFTERAGQYNASNALQSAMANQQTQQQRDLAQFGANTDAARYGADVANQGALANRDTAIQYAMTQFGVDSQNAARFADALNASSQAGYQGNLQTALTQAGFNADQARYYADQVNQTNLAQAGYTQQTNLANQALQGQYGLAQAGYTQQAGQQNMDAINQFLMQQGLFDFQTGQYNTTALNDFLVKQMGMDADSARYYADALNQSSQFNANMQEQDYLRQLQAAGMLGDLSNLYGTQQRADLGLTADLGQVQRGIESEYLNAYPTQLQLAGNLYQNLYPGIYAGTNSVSKTSGGLLPTILGSAAQGAASAIAFSDRRLKTDIERIGAHGPLGLYSFRYIGDGGRRVGVMADEVAEHMPEALGPTVDGYATVDYDRLGLGHLNGGMR